MNATKTKRIQRTTLAHRRLFYRRRRKTYHDDGLLCVCVYSEAREANERG